MVFYTGCQFFYNTTVGIFMKKILIVFLCIAVLFLSGLVYSDITNPYGRLTQVKAFFSVYTNQYGQLELEQVRNISFIENPFINLITYTQRFFRTVGNAQFSEQPFKGNEWTIIDQIHKKRFDITKPYVISGAHFAEFYVRNFGIFYSAMLDPRFALSKTDWENREKVTLQTLATHLALVQRSEKEYTTFIPITNTTFTGVNWATDPSDSLFAVYYTLSGLTDDHFIANTFPASASALYSLQTQDAGTKLLAQYKKTLTAITNGYLNYVLDKQTGLIKKNITLSSARDGLKRQSSFYDNVIAWGTAKFAMNLGISIACPQVLTSNNTCDFEKWKQKIIAAFWDEKTGIFIDDLSSDSMQNHIYSGDAFIVTSTKFLDFQNANDREKIEREISYVQKNHLDKPFPLRYAISDQPEKLYFFVRYFAPSYMGNTIWSHWGMEYVKTLILLAKDNPSYLSDAEIALAAYKNNIEKFGGYPEVYDALGNMYQTPFYKSILHTGWVVNYEQAVMMYNSNK